MVRIDSEGYTTGAVFLTGAVLLRLTYGVIGWPVLMWAALFCLVLAGYTLYFFRDPHRIIPEEAGTAVSSADGVIVDVSNVVADGFNGGALRIAVFMNVFNVHINRIPVAGTVINTTHCPGKKLSAYNKRAEYENEYTDTEIETSYGLIRVRQIAGLIARRVVARAKTGDTLKKGDRIGLIRFGSRVDVFFPYTFKPAVKNGDRVRAAETVIARLNEV